MRLYHLMMVEDAVAVVGRQSELALIDQFLSDPSSPPVLHLSGAPGIGKSVIAAEAGRQVVSDGGKVRRVTGDGSSTLTSLRTVTGSDVLIIDDYEYLVDREEELLGDLLPSFPAGIRVLVASRLPPGPQWREGGWEAAALAVTLGPLDEVASRLLLARWGVSEPETVEPLIEWAGGEPLPLVLAAQVATSDQAFDPASPDSHSGLIDRLADELLRDELDRVPGPERRDEVLTLTALSGSLDRELLVAVLPDVDAAGAERWLRSLSFTKPLGTKVALDERVARVLKSGLRLGSADEEREMLVRMSEKQSLPRPRDTVDVVRDALRSLHEPTALVSSPLATGSTADERATSVRSLIRQTVDEAFGGSEDDRLLQRVVEAAYLDPSSSHEAAARRLHLSRATYFRRLRAAVERLAHHMSGRVRDGA